MSREPKISGVRVRYLFTPSNSVWADIVYKECCPPYVASCQGLTMDDMAQLICTMSTYKKVLFPTKEVEVPF